MIKAYYDLHVHSCLSPCADDDMTPNNIVNMAIISGLDIIAITDHNSCQNCRAVMEAGNKLGLCVVPGMELCTSEEIHVVCLFFNIDDAERFELYVKENSIIIENNEKVFGNQILMDCNDNKVGNEKRLLLSATNISICDMNNLMLKFNGIVFPAHVDRNSYSILSVLGDFSDETKFSCAEITNMISKPNVVAKHKKSENIRFICNSDAHRLEDIAKVHNYIDLENCKIFDLINELK